MKASLFISCASFVVAAFGTSVPAQTSDSVIEEIVTKAKADNIDLTVLAFSDSALQEIAATYEAPPAVERRDSSRPIPRQVTTSVDVHGHVVPSWYRRLVPISAGNPTPVWDLKGYLSFMASEGIAHAIFGFSSPGANVFQGSKSSTAALARLMNEQSAAYCRAHPHKLDFYATVPLPYTKAAITEAKYALNVLGAVGIILTSNFEGSYLGNPEFRPFFDAINKMGGRRIIFIHPSIPYVRVNNKLVEANPTPYPTGNVEFVFETARTLMDLTLTQTIHNFTNLHYIIPHVGGTFPAIIDRFLKLVPDIYDSSLNVFKTRFWWDSAGPTYFHQVSGLLGYDIPKSQLLFGTDFPYVPSFTQAGSLAAIQNSPLLTPAEKTALFSANAQTLFGPKIVG